jgi:EAL domain-containing protein (putative c-di-GMP-specific phosphodiesterase class I)
VAPAEFISIAEETGIIGALGRYVLQSALADLADWRREGLIDAGAFVSVNLSAGQLEDRGLRAEVAAALHTAGLPPSALKLEITEATLMREVERPGRVFDELAAAGIGLRLDDLGTGFSSLATLHRLPVEALKVDASFVAAISGATDTDDLLLRSTVGLAHGLELPAIAEGLESTAQLMRLRSLGCEYGQGHRFAPALAAADVRGLLAGWAPSQIAAA